MQYLVPNTLIHQRYIVVRSLGQGGMGAVYEAIDQRLSQTVALKQLLLTGDEVQRAFEREAQILARLRHTALPRVIDYFSDANGRFLVMDYVSGDDLGTLLQRRNAPLTLPTTLKLADHILDVLSYLHSQNPPVIHRDIKPQNLKLSTDGNIILLDFGLAKGKPELQSSLTAGISVRGYTPQYAPLEQIQATGTDARSDLYSLAATLYLLLANLFPVDVLQRASVLVMGHPDPLRPLHEVVPSIPVPISEVVMQAMALRPEDRIANAATMRQMLAQAASAGGTVPAAPATGKTVVLPAAQPYVQTPAPPKQVPHVAQKPSPQPAKLGAKPVQHHQPIQPPPQPVAKPLSYPISLENCRSVEPLVCWGRGTVQSLEWLPQGRVLVLATAEGISLYDGDSLALIREFETTELVRTIAFSEDGHMASVAASNQVQVWRLRDGKLLTTLQRFMGWVGIIAFMPNGKTLLSDSYDGTLRLWQISDGSLLRTFMGHAGRVADFAIASNGMFFVSTARDATILVWSVRHPRPIRSLQSNSSVVCSVAINPSGSMVASGLEDGTIRLWHFQQRKIMDTFRDMLKGYDQVLEGHTATVRSLAYNPSGNLLASSANDGTIKLWNPHTEKVVQELEGHTNRVDRVRFSADGSLLAARTIDYRVCIWRVQDGTLLHTMRQHAGCVKDVACSPDGSCIATATGNHTIVVRTVPDGRVLHTLAGHTAVVNGVAFSPDGGILASASSDMSVRIWRVQDGALLQTLTGHRGEVVRVAFSPDGTTLASAASDKDVLVWRVQDGAIIYTLRHANRATSVAYNHDGSMLATASTDCKVRLWNMRDGKLIERAETHESGVLSLTFTADGATLLSGDEDGMVCVWRVFDGTVAKTHQDPRLAVQSIAVLADGAMFATASVDHAIYFWRMRDLSMVHTLKGHTAAVHSVVFSPDGTLLVSGSEDGTVGLWGFETR